MKSCSIMSAMITLCVISADKTGLLRYIEKEGVTLYHVHQVDDLTIHLQIRKHDQNRLYALLNKRGAQVNIVSRNGLYWKIQAIAKHPVLLLGIAIILIAGLLLPTRIYFFRVEGNHTIPSQMILEAAEQAGITFGASARGVRSEKMKNALLQAIPQLQWAGINTTGCVATISVKERQIVQQQYQPKGVSSIVAVRDGIICDMIVEKGSPVCKVGQAVSKGQVLVSGYTNCEQSITATRSNAEIYATTVRQINAILPTNYSHRGSQEKSVVKFGIIFGKKRINFYSGSGILGNSCVKMYEENYVTLPGGFQLPVAIFKETWINSQACSEDAAIQLSEQTLSTLSKRYLKGQMLAGNILSSNEHFFQHDGSLSLTGEYNCIEMIGREQNEEIIKP